MDKKKPVRYIAFAGGGLIIVAALLGLYLWYPEINERTVHRRQCRYVKIVTVEYATSFMKNSFPGVVQAATSVNLFFRVSGPLIEVNVSPGDNVKQGQVLMRIDPRDYEKHLACARNVLTAAGARLRAMKAGARPEDIEILRKELEAAKAKFEEMMYDYKRTGGLYKSRAVSKAQLDRSKSQYVNAQANIAVLKQRLKMAVGGARKEDIAAAEAEYRQLENNLAIAADQLNDTSLRAPFDGTITKQYIENHEMVLQGSPVLRMNDISTINIAIDLPEEIMHNLKKIRNLECQVRFTSIPEEIFKAKVTEWSIDAEPVSKTYEMLLSMKQPENYKILPGMAAEVTGDFNNIDIKKPAVAIPSAAIVSKAGAKSIVWVVRDNNRVSKRIVKVGKNVDSDRVLVFGLKPGERIVAGGANFVTPELEVRNIKEIEFGENK
ncbi:MAG: efflux RND transporter periplasmic adaptor subunit [Victivallaceae bacterium]|nr:efflux RND transporter periplasmic adaptor subunit [Victivallaceae bacterium]